MRIVSPLQGGLGGCQHIFLFFLFFFLPETFIKVISSQSTGFVFLKLHTRTHTQLSDTRF